MFEQLNGIASHVLDVGERSAFHDEGARLVERFDDTTEAPDIDLGGVSVGIREFVTHFAANTTLPQPLPDVLRAR